MYLPIGWSINSFTRPLCGLKRQYNKNNNNKFVRAHSWKNNIFSIQVHFVYTLAYAGLFSELYWNYDNSSFQHLCLYTYNTLNYVLRTTFKKPFIGGH